MNILLESSVEEFLLEVYLRREQVVVDGNSIFAIHHSYLVNTRGDTFT